MHKHAYVSFLSHSILSLGLPAPPTFVVGLWAVSYVSLVSHKKVIIENQAPLAEFQGIYLYEGDMGDMGDNASNDIFHWRSARCFLSHGCLTLFRVGDSLPHQIRRQVIHPNFSNPGKPLFHLWFPRTVFRQISTFG